MKLRTRLLLGVVLVILVTVTLSTLGVSYLVLRQNDQNGKEMVSLGGRLVTNRLTALQSDALEKVRRFASSAENLVNLKYLETSGKEGAGHYLFTLDHPKEEMAERLYALLESGPFDAFRLFGSGGELLALAEMDAGHIVMGIGSFDASGESVFKYQKLLPGTEVEHPWEPGAVLERMHLVQDPPSERGFWFSREGEGMALVGVLPILRGAESSWGDPFDTLGRLEFRVPVGRVFADQLASEIGMAVEVLAGVDSSVAAVAGSVRILDLKAVPHYRVEIPLEGDSGVAGMIAVSFSREDALRKARENILFLLCLTAVCLVVAGPASFWVANRFSGRIDQVLLAVERISGGDLDARVEKAGTDELGSLGDAVNVMAADLRTLLDKLSQSESKYRSIYENALKGIFQSDPEGRLLNVSPALSRILGYDSPSELLLCATCLLDPQLSPPQDRALLQGLLLKGENISGCETRLRKKDGSPIWVMISAKPIAHSAEGQGAAIFQGFVVDITELKAAEEALRENEQLFRATLESTAEGVLVVDSQGMVSHSNRRFREIWGVPEAIMVDRSDNRLLEYVLPQLIDPEEFLAGGRTIYNSNDATQCLLHFKDGRVLERFSAPVVREGGSNSRVWFFRDITPQVEAELAIRGALDQAQEARARVDAILQSVPHGLMVIDMEGRVLLLNRSAERLMGVCLEDVFQFPVSGILKEEAFLARVATTFEGQEAPAALEMELFDHDRAEVRNIQTAISLVRQGQQSASGAVVVLLDVTRERELARMKSEFVSVAAHELNTPLAAVLGYVELLINQEEMGGFSAEEQRDFLCLIYEKGEALSRIVDELLFISRMEVGSGMLIEPSPFEAQEMIRKTVDLFRMGSPVNRFSLNLPSGPVALVADRGKVVQVLENLISNAVKYSPAASPVMVSCQVDNGSCFFSVEDEGIGMTEEQVERIFEKFYRADFSNTAVGGLGLGMCIVKKIIEVHGGSIEVKSALGQGTQVRFSLPLEPSAGSMFTSGGCP